MPTTSLPADDLSAALAVEVRVALTRRGVTQTELCTALGKQAPWLSRRMTGHTHFTVHELVELCASLEADPADLMTSALASCRADV